MCNVKMMNPERIDTGLFNSTQLVSLFELLFFVLQVLQLVLIEPHSSNSIVHCSAPDSRQTELATSW